MGTISHATQLQCDYCGAQSELFAGARPEGWLAAPFESGGMRVHDACPACLARPFHEVVAMLTGKMQAWLLRQQEFDRSHYGNGS